MIILYNRMIVWYIFDETEEQNLTQTVQRDPVSKWHSFDAKYLCISNEIMDCQRALYLFLMAPSSFH